MDVLQVDVGVSALAVVDLDVRLIEESKLVVKDGSCSTAECVIANRSRICGLRSCQELGFFLPLFFSTQGVASLLKM